MDFFGTPWRDLTIKDLRRFLTGADDEGLTWEAKGTTLDKSGVVKTACAFANTAGGFLLLGVSKDSTDGWIADGVKFPPRTEPGTWVSQVLQDNLRPVPPHDAQVYRTKHGRVAVVQVGAVAEPPCMTQRGEVFVRVVGASRKVEEPETLRRLFERGETAIMRAEATSELAIVSREFAPAPDSPFLVVGLSLGPTGMADDVASRLFTETFESALGAQYESLPPDPLYFEFPEPVMYRTRMSWDALHAEPTVERRNLWRISVGWNGSVTVWFEARPEPDDAHVLASAVIESVVSPMMRVSTALLRSLGSFGRAHAQLRFERRRFQLDGGPRTVRFPTPRMKAWTNLDGAFDDEQLSRWHRELTRAAGFKAYEPT